MQYSVLGTDGNQYGPVDIATLKQWVTEGRVLPTSQVTDNLSNRTMIASQMPELGLLNRTSVVPPPAPPSGFGDYPRPGMTSPQQQSVQGSVLGNVIFRVILALGISTFTRTGGLIVSSFTIYYAIRALINKDPNGIWCLLLSLLSLVLIGLWTLYKVAKGINSY